MNERTLFDGDFKSTEVKSRDALASTGILQPPYNGKFFEEIVNKVQ